MKALGHRHGSYYCLLLDTEADTAEVVTQDGFTLVDEARPEQLELVPSYREETLIGSLGDVMLRIADATEAPVGVMLEGFSRRSRPRWRGGTGLEPLALLAELIVLTQEFCPPTYGQQLEVMQERAGANGGAALPER